MSSLASPQARLLRALAKHRVDFVVVGGVAAQLHGWDGATNDLAISVSREDDNVMRLNRALSSVGARNQMVSRLGTVYQTDHGRLEIVSVADGIGGFEDWSRDAADHEVEKGLVIVLAAADDIVRSKEAAGRAKDLAALPTIRRSFIDAGVIDSDSVRGPVAVAAKADGGPPQFLIDLLGPRPSTRSGRWDVVAQTVLEYRQRWEVSGVGIGDDPIDAKQAADRRRIEAVIAALKR